MKNFFFLLADARKPAEQEREKEKSCAKKEKEASLRSFVAKRRKKPDSENQIPVEKQKLKEGAGPLGLPLQVNIQNIIANMRFQELKSIVGVANVKITSEMRYSELRSLVEKASILEQSLLTIVVKSGTLSDSEIIGLTTLGKSYVQFDLTD